MRDVTDELARRPYPGRGCLAARTVDGDLALLYFLSGRSPVSRARELLPQSNGDIAVASTVGHGNDPLRHYTAAAQRGPWTVIGNGDHVVPIVESLAAHDDEVAAAQRYTYEPDGPIFTTRIWLTHQRGGRSDCAHGYARRSDRGAVDHVVWSLSLLAPGTGSLMTTYAGTVSEVRPQHAPVDVKVAASTAGDLLQDVWGALDPTLRVAGFAITPDDAQGRPLFIS